MNHTNFLLEVATALAGCQAVELELKLYIEQANICRGQTTTRDLSERPLGKLIKDFKRLRGNCELSTRLGQFREKRNFVAHQAISSCLKDDGSIDNRRIAASHLNLNTVQRDARDLVNEVAAEHSKLFIIEENVPISPDAADEPSN